MVRNRRAQRRPNGSRELPVRSVRVSDEVWGPAAFRAEMENTTMSAVLHDFVDGYGKGKINRPGVTLTYDPALQTPAALANQHAPHVPTQMAVGE